MEEYIKAIILAGLCAVLLLILALFSFEVDPRNRSRYTCVDCNTYVIQVPHSCEPE